MHFICLRNPEQLNFNKLPESNNNNNNNNNMSASQPILLYAELLSNIRQVSIGCSLHSPSSSDTQVIVSPDGLEFTVNHDGIKTSIRLPACVSSPQKLSVQNLDTKSLSWRLPLSSTLGQSREFLNASEEQAIPWSASDLQSESPIACRTCHAAIVESGHIKVWKDLPSENWAEMMEFWHCHKPHDHGHGHGDDLTSKGYGASSRISAQSGVGFVDLTSFLLSETDISMSAVSLSLFQPFNWVNRRWPDRLFSSSMVWKPILLP